MSSNARRTAGAALACLLLSLGAAVPAAAQDNPQEPVTATPPDCPYPETPIDPRYPNICHPYPQPRPAASKQTTTGCPGDCLTRVDTGEGIFPKSNPFNFETFPGTNFLPTIYTNMFDGNGKEMPNTLPSTPDTPYNLHDGPPVVTEINPLSPINDLETLFAAILRDAGELSAEPEGLAAALRQALDVLEGEPVENRAYSGFPMLHYTGPEKVRKVEPIRDQSGKVIGGNVTVRQIWFDQRIEADTAFLDVSEVQDVPWTVTYVVNMLDRGHDDFSPFVMYTDDPAIQPGLPHVGMDQSFFPMEEGTRTVFKIKMTPGKYYNLVYNWGWRLHPPRIQVMENAAKKINYGNLPHEACPAEYQGKTLPQLEQAVFCPPDDPGCTSVRCARGEARFDDKGQPTACEQRKLFAISRIGDLAPAKRMWNALREAHDAARRGDFRAVREIVASQAKPAFEDWQDRTNLPAGVEVDLESDLTLLYVNNTTYAQFTRGNFNRWNDWEERPKTLKVTILNGDPFVHSYIVADFGGNRGWENQFKSSVRVAGSGCWFTFGRNHWAMAVGGPNGYLCVPETNGLAPGRHRVEITFNYDPSRRLRFYQFDPFHHDVAIYSVH